MKRNIHKYVGYLILQALIGAIGFAAPVTGQSQVSKDTSILKSSPPPWTFAKVVPVICTIKSPCYGLSGKVHVEVVINPDGIPINVKAVSGDPRLMKPAESAVRQYRFRFTTHQTGRNDVRTSFDVIVPPPEK